MYSKVTRIEKRHASHRRERHIWDLHPKQGFNFLEKAPCSINEKLHAKINKKWCCTRLFGTAVNLGHGLPVAVNGKRRSRRETSRQRSASQVLAKIPQCTIKVAKISEQPITQYTHILGILSHFYQSFHFNMHFLPMFYVAKKWENPPEDRRSLRLNFSDPSSSIIQSRDRVYKIKRNP